MNQLAWILATCDDPEIRDGRKAVAFAEKAVVATGRKDPAILDTLAAACAQAGEFGKAVSAAKEALALPQDEGLRKALESHLRLFENHLPYRER